MNPHKIILHHSLTKDSGTVSWGVIRKYHVNDLKWLDIGYHFGIEDMRGQVEIVCGRMPDEIGAHCSRHNSDSIGICFVGNFDIKAPPKEKWNAGLKLVEYLIKAYDIKEVYGHRELNPGKSCPGRLFDLNRFRKELFG